MNTHSLSRLLCIAGLALALTASRVPLAQAAQFRFESSRDFPLVHLSVAIPAGAAHDPAKRSGLANVLGEMLLRGTTSRSKQAIDLELDRLGASLAVETRSESLIVRGSVLSRELLPFLELLADIVRAPAFSKQELDKLRSEVISELDNQLGNDAQVASRRFQRWLLGDHPYANPTLGTHAGLRLITPQDLRDAYDHWVRDDSLFVAGSGDADPAVIEKWARSLIADRPGAAKLPTIDPPTPSESPARRLILIDKPGRTQTQILLGRVGITMTDPRYYALHLANQAFGGGSFEARLMREVRVARGWSYGAYSSFKYSRLPRSWSLYLFPSAQYVDQALKLALELTESFAANGVTEPEFNFARTSLINSAGFLYNTPLARVENMLTEHLLGLAPGFVQQTAAALAKEHHASVQATLAQWWKTTGGQRAPLSILVLASVTPELKQKLARAADVPLSDVRVVDYRDESLTSAPAGAPRSKPKR